MTGVEKIRAMRARTATVARWNHSDSGRASQAKHRKTAGWIESQKRYKITGKGKVAASKKEGASGYADRIIDGFHGCGVADTTVDEEWKI